MGSGASKRSGESAGAVTTLRQATPRQQQQQQQSTTETEPEISPPQSPSPPPLHPLGSRRDSAREDDSSPPPLKPRPKSHAPLSFRQTSSSSLTVPGKTMSKRRSITSLLKRRGSDWRDWHKNTIFRQFFLPIFEKADADKDGLLNGKEFLDVIRSGTLNLDISFDEAKRIWDAANKDRDGALSFKEFLPLVRELIIKAYASSPSKSSWCQIGWSSSDEGALPIYLNKDDGTVTYEPPEAFETDEAHFFDMYKRTTTGAVITAMETETGERLYLNFETEQWLPIPADWTDLELIPCRHRESLSSAAQLEMQKYARSSYKVQLEDFTTFRHPETGAEYRLWPEKRTVNVPYFFDDTANEWRELPLAWEAQHPSIAKALSALREAVPGWASENERGLALRLNNYDVAETIRWKANQRDGSDTATLSFSMPALHEEEEVDGRDPSSEEISQQAGGEEEARVGGPEISGTTASAGPGPLVEDQRADQQAGSPQLTKDEITSTLQALADELKKGNERESTLTSKLTSLEEHITLQQSNQRADLAAQLSQLEGQLKHRENEIEMRARIAFLEEQLKAKDVEVEQSKKAQAAAQTLAEELSGQHRMQKSAEEELRQREKELILQTTGLQKQLAELSAKQAESFSSSARRSEAVENAPPTEEFTRKESLQRASEAQQTLALALQRQQVATCRDMAENLKGENRILRALMEQRALELKGLVKQLSSYSSSLLLAAGNSQHKVDFMRDKYQTEVLKRKLLYNKLQELRGNVRVFCRCRSDDRVPCALTFPSVEEVVFPGTHGPKIFEFDQVYGNDATQEEVYRETSPIVTSCMDGYNACIIAYGQTGSGKTYTMMGTKEDRGVNWRALEELFSLCGKDVNVSFTFELSMMEVYNEHVYDLLVPFRGNPVNVHVRPNGSVLIEDMHRFSVKIMEDVKSAFELGEKNRTVAMTQLNAHSSRSHLIMTVFVSGENKITGAVSRGKLTLVDLAGSERVSKSQASGQRLIEAAAINKSLVALGLVFQALIAKQKHVPYRNSKLTTVLQDTLGGDSKTCVFINVSPAKSNLAETESTLNFGKSIGAVELGPARQHMRFANLGVEDPSRRKATSAVASP